MIVYASIMNHVKRAGYRPDIITENWIGADKRILFCGDDQDVAECRSFPGDSYAWNMDLVEIGTEIKTPSDISRMENMVLEYCWGIGADWVVYVMGDIYITKHGDELIQRFINKPGSSFCTLYTMYYQMYVQLQAQYNTILVVSRDNKVIIHDDGARVTFEGQVCLSNGGCLHMPINDNLEYVNSPAQCNMANALDIGYLGTPQYAAKMYNHNFIWPDYYKQRWLSLWDQDKRQAIKWAIQQNNNKPWKPIDTKLYGHSLDRLDQWDDYHMCMEVLSTML